MKQEKLTDDQLIIAIQAGGKQRMQAIRQVYEWKKTRNAIRYFIKSNQGNEQDAQDVFHEGIIQLDLNVREGKFRGEGNLSGYLLSTCRYIWLNKLRKSSRVDLEDEALDTRTQLATDPEALFLQEEKKKLLQNALDHLDERCQKILRMWQLSYSMDEIAAAVGLSSRDMAKKSRYRCHQKLMNLLSKDPVLMEGLKK